MKNKIVDIICVCLVFVIFGSVACLNLIQSDRPVRSEVEGRELARMPEFSVKTLLDGTYFSGVSLFVSDTFLYRDELVSLSKKMDTLRGMNYTLGDDGNFVVLGPTTETPGDDNSDVSDKISEALDNLKNNETSTSGDETAPIEGQTPGGEIVDDPNETESGEVTPPENVVTAIHLSKKSIRLTIGSGAVVSATVESSSTEAANVRWSVSDKNIVSISMNPTGGIDVKGLAEGTCTLTCSYNDEIKETCEITVIAINSVTTVPNDEQADFLTNGMFIYGDAVYTQAYFNQSGAKSFASTASFYKTLFGPNTRVSTVVIPVSSMVVDNEEVKKTIQDQNNILIKMKEFMDPSVNFVNVYPKMHAHRDEYLFFKSDHHWTGLGAYYAYAAFAESVGLTPTPLDELNYSIINDKYSGSLYSFTHDERVKKFTDTIEAYTSKKPLSMTVTGATGVTSTYNSCVVSGNKTYVTFIAGDNPYTVINVPGNPQDKNILVLKDSFGNAFVPYLCEHYGNIIVVDVRYSSFNIYEHLRDYGLTDIVFVNNIQAANSDSWSKMYMKAVGVELN